LSILIILLALGFLMFVAYRGLSVILFAPVAAVLAVLLTNPAWVPAYFSGIFMERMVVFVKLYFPVFLLGALFGKLIEISGFARSIIQAVIRFAGLRHAMLAVVAVCAILTYGGVSLFVVAFAVYPFAAELFRAANVPKRLIPATIGLGPRPLRWTRCRGRRRFRTSFRRPSSAPTPGRRRGWGCAEGFSFSPPG
jgi:H+/gluconate symporter-like permease